MAGEIMSAKVPLIGCLAATLYMTGVIVFVRTVHYPLFAKVPGEAFRAYHGEHVRLTTLVVLLPMVAELLLSISLVANPPSGTPRGLAWAGLTAALFTWAVTAFGSVPSHDVLATGFDPAAHARLIRADSFRIAGWLAHSVILLWMTWRAIPES